MGEEQSLPPPEAVLQSVDNFIPTPGETAAMTAEVTRIFTDPNLRDVLAGHLEDLFQEQNATAQEIRVARARDEAEIILDQAPEIAQQCITPAHRAQTIEKLAFPASQIRPHVDTELLSQIQFDRISSILTGEWDGNLQAILPERAKEKLITDNPDAPLLQWTRIDLLKPPAHWDPEDDQAGALFMQQLETETGQLTEMEPPIYFFHRAKTAETISGVLENLIARPGLSGDVQQTIQGMLSDIEPWRQPEARILPYRDGEMHLPHHPDEIDGDTDYHTLETLFRTVNEKSTLRDTVFSPRYCADSSRVDMVSLSDYLASKLQLFDTENFAVHIMSLTNAIPSKVRLFTPTPTELSIYVGSSGSAGDALPENLTAKQQYAVFFPRLGIDPAQQPETGRYWPSLTHGYRYDSIHGAHQLEAFLTATDAQNPRPALWKKVIARGRVQEPQPIYRTQNMLVIPGK